MMINSVCGSMASLKSEMGKLSSSPNGSSSIADMNKTHSSIDLDQQNNLPTLKYELDGDLEVQSPDNSLWDHYFTDLLEGDFMISSPVLSISSPQGSNTNHVHHFLECSPPRLSSQFGQMSRGKKLSPLHRVFNSPNNNNAQFMQTESLSQLELQGFLDGNYEKEIDDLLACLPVKNGWNSSSERYDAVPTLLDCLSLPNSSSFCGTQESDVYQRGRSVIAPLSQQLQQERQNDKLMPRHQTLPPLQDASASMSLIASDQDEDSGLQLVHLLLACAEAVAKDEYMQARRYLHHLNGIVTPLGDSMQRVASFFTDALSARLTATLSTKSSTLMAPFVSPFFPPNSLEILKIYQILYQACPYVKFAHFTANQAIFEAFEGEECVHIIDLDILQGYQWPAFMQALAARPGGAPFLRITGVGPSDEAVRETGRCLTELAHSLHVPFEFHPVGEKLQDLKPHMFNRRVGEALAVNSVNKLHKVPINSLGNLLSMIRDQAPNIVTVVEQEASHNGPYFLGRFLEALHYYSAIFDSLDATFPPDSAQRAKVEQYIFAPEIRNIVATEGVERVIRHERLDKWRKIMEGKGFQGVALSSNAVTQSKILLGLYSCDGYKLTQDKGCLLLGWQDRPILAASAWRC